jgi:hypothetical protein
MVCRVGVEPTMFTTWVSDLQSDAFNHLATDTLDLELKLFIYS